MSGPTTAEASDDRALTADEQRKIDEMLALWLDRARVALSAFNDATTRTVASERRLGIPAVFLSSVVATGVFATLQKDPALGFRIATGVIAVVAAVLGALQTFLRQAERAEQYREAARSYGRLRRRIERARLLPPETRDAADALLDELGDALAEAARGKPNVPQRIWDRAEYKVKGTTDARAVRAFSMRLRDRLDFGVGDRRGALAEDHTRYFSGLDDARIIPVEQIRPSKSHTDSVTTARQRMQEAAAGARDPRPPLDVRHDADDGYVIVDGNATFEVARQEGWSTVPVRLVDTKNEVTT